MPKIVSTIDRARQNIGGGEAEIGDNRQDRGAQRMGVDAARRQAEGAQGADVGLGEGVAQRRLRQPRDDGDLRQGERHNGQRLIFPRAIVPAADRKRAQRQAKEKLKQRRDNKSGQDDADERRGVDRAGAKLSAPAAARGPGNPQRAANQKRDDHGLGAKPHRNWQRMSK